MTVQFDQIETIDPVDHGSKEEARRRPCLTVLFHPDTRRVGQRVVLFDSSRRPPVSLSRLEPDFCNVDGSNPQPLASVCLSRRPVWIAPAGAGGVLLSPDPKGTELVADGEMVLAPREFQRWALVRGVVLELARRVVLLLHAVEPPGPRAARLGFVGESDAIDQLRRGIVRVAGLSAPVLLRGETGVGKELSALAIHRSSARGPGPFLCVNLAAMPTSTAASELFGHAQGAFTGATREHRGYFERADGGTLFMDEVGSAPAEIQSMLLRVLETGELQPVGGRASRTVDVRVLAATDEDLEASIDAGRFRAPLYHRLSGCSIEVPPLRARRDDIGRLLVHFLRQELDAVDALQRLDPPAEGAQPWLPAALVADLARYSWPGNVRQLHNAARQLVANHRDSKTVDAKTALRQLLGAQPVAGSEDKAESAVPTPRVGPTELGEDELLAAMRNNRFRISATAEMLGISRNSLYTLIDRSPRLRKAKDIPADEIERCFRECSGDLDAMVDRLEVSKRAIKLRLKDLGLV